MRAAQPPCLGDRVAFRFEPGDCGIAQPPHLCGLSMIRAARDKKPIARRARGNSAQYCIRKQCETCGWFSVPADVTSASPQLLVAARRIDRDRHACLIAKPTEFN